MKAYSCSGKFYTMTIENPWLKLFLAYETGQRDAQAEIDRQEALHNPFGVKRHTQRLADQSAVDGTAGDIDERNPYHKD